MDKIKYFLGSEQGKDLLVILIVILVGISSFELGRLSKTGANAGLRVEYPNQEGANSTLTSGPIPAYASSNFTSQSITGKAFFASSRGKKYYSLGCSAGKSIKQENRVYFESQAEAEKAGYTKSSSC